MTRPVCLSVGWFVGRLSHYCLKGGSLHSIAAVGALVLALVFSVSSMDTAGWPLSSIDICMNWPGKKYWTLCVYVRLTEIRLLVQRVQIQFKFNSQFSYNCANFSSISEDRYAVAPPRRRRLCMTTTTTATAQLFSQFIKGIFVRGEFWLFAHCLF